MGCAGTCIHVCTIACGPEGSPPWCQGTRKGGCEFVVEDVRDTCEGHLGLCWEHCSCYKSYPNGYVIGGYGYSPLVINPTVSLNGASYDVSLYLQYGQSPLMMASSGGHFEIVKVLLDEGAEVNHLNKVSYS